MADHNTENEQLGCRLEGIIQPNFLEIEQRFANIYDILPMLVMRETPFEEWQCTNCRQLLVRAYRACCNHRFCGRCVDSLVIKSKRGCPLDQEPIFRNPIVRQLEEKKIELRVHCIRVLCPYGCGEECFILDLLTHKLECNEYKKDNFQHSDSIENSYVRALGIFEEKLDVMHFGILGATKLMIELKGMVDSLAQTRPAVPLIARKTIPAMDDTLNVVRSQPRKSVRSLQEKPTPVSGAGGDSDVMKSRHGTELRGRLSEKVRLGSGNATPVKMATSAMTSSKKNVPEIRPSRPKTSSPANTVISSEIKLNRETSQSSGQSSISKSAASSDSAAKYAQKAPSPRRQVAVPKAKVGATAQPTGKPEKQISKSSTASNNLKLKKIECHTSKTVTKSSGEPKKSKKMAEVAIKNTISDKAKLFWPISSFKEKMAAASSANSKNENYVIRSATVVMPCGYAFCLEIDPGVKSISVTLKAVEGENDNKLRWPFEGVADIEILDGSDQLCHRKSKIRLTRASNLAAESIVLAELPLPDDFRRQHRTCLKTDTLLVKMWIKREEFIDPGTETKAIMHGDSFTDVNKEATVLKCDDLQTSRDEVMENKCESLTISELDISNNTSDIQQTLLSISKVETTDEATEIEVASDSKSDDVKDIAQDLLLVSQSEATNEPTETEQEAIRSFKSHSDEVISKTETTHEDEEIEQEAIPVSHGDDNAAETDDKESKEIEQDLSPSSQIEITTETGKRILIYQSDDSQIDTINMITEIEQEIIRSPPVDVNNGTTEAAYQSYDTDDKINCKATEIKLEVSQSNDAAEMESFQITKSDATNDEDTDMEHEIVSLVQNVTGNVYLADAADKSIPNSQSNITDETIHEEHETGSISTRNCLNGIIVDDTETKDSNKYSLETEDGTTSDFQDGVSENAYYLDSVATDNGTEYVEEEEESKVILVSCREFNGDEENMDNQDYMENDHSQ